MGYMDLIITPKAIFYLLEGNYRVSGHARRLGFQGLGYDEPDVSDLA